jgi:outer membrane protein
MKKHLLAAVAVAACASGAVYAQDFKAGDMLVRARAVGLYSANGGSTTPNLDLSVNDKAIPEVDVSYFFSKNLAAELILTIPQEHNLRSAGTKIATLEHLPPTLTLQYHFDMGGFKPYVGAGVNFTKFSKVRFDPAVAAALGPTITKDSVGFAIQAGVDIPLSKTMFLNVDVKKVQIGTDVKSFGSKIGELKVDPVLFGIGLGWKF